MRSRIGVMILICLLTSIPPMAMWSAASPQLTPDFAAIDACAEMEQRALGIPGLALGIVHGDQIVHLQGFGMADESE